MKAISLRQPWAYFVSVKLKTIETRTHQRFKSLVGQRIAIHSGQKSGCFAMQRLVPLLSLSPFILENINSTIEEGRGNILCTAIVTAARWAPNVDFVEREEWNLKALCETAGMFCLFLDDIKPLSDIIPFRGRQGIFEVPDKLIKI